MQIWGWEFPWPKLGEILGCLQSDFIYWVPWPEVPVLCLCFPTHLKLKVGNKISLSVPIVATLVSLSKFFGQEEFCFKIKVAKFCFFGFVGRYLSLPHLREADGDVATQIYFSYQLNFLSPWNWSFGLLSCKGIFPFLAQLSLKCRMWLIHIPEGQLNSALSFSWWLSLGQIFTTGFGIPLVRPWVRLNWKMLLDFKGLIRIFWGRLF